ncbi:LexA family protein [Seminibacterium arietis]|uniref:LexA family protein n=1 Tax=Seminibacterium arietis TaxID=1173502 RepID=A0ABW3I909_9PAST
MMKPIANIAMQKKLPFSYCPIPFYSDNEQIASPFSKKLDLNLYCIKHPTKTCFIQVKKPNMIAWGIEEGDILIVEQNERLSTGDLVVIASKQGFSVYELISDKESEFIFLPLNAKMNSIRISDSSQLPIIGVITNIIHQIKSNKLMRLVA